MKPDVGFDDVIEYRMTLATDFPSDFNQNAQKEKLTAAAVATAIV
jgi:hypothetical protein